MKFNTGIEAIDIAGDLAPFTVMGSDDLYSRTLAARIIARHAAQQGHPVLFLKRPCRTTFPPIQAGCEEREIAYNLNPQGVLKVIASLDVRPKLVVVDGIHIMRASDSGGSGQARRADESSRVGAELLLIAEGQCMAILGLSNTLHDRSHWDSVDPFLDFTFKGLAIHAGLVSLARQTKEGIEVRCFDALR